MEGEFPSNSKSRNPGPVEPEKNVEKVIEGTAIRRKKSLGKRFAEVFVIGDIKGVTQYVLLEVLLPAAKDAVADVASSFVERSLFGDTRAGHRRPGMSHSRPSGTPGYVSYNRFGPGSREEARPNLSRRARATHNFDELLIPTRAEAEMVLSSLYDLIGKYEQATVMDLYDLVGETGQYTDNKWGWEDLRGSGVTRSGGGYLLDLPKPVPLA